MYNMSKDETFKDVEKVLSTKAIKDCIESFLSTFNLEVSLVTVKDEKCISFYEGNFNTHIFKSCESCSKEIEKFKHEFGIGGLTADVKIGKRKVAIIEIYYIHNKLNQMELEKKYNSLQLEKKGIKIEEFKKSYYSLCNKIENTIDINSYKSLVKVLANLISQVATQQLTLFVIQDISNQISNSLDLKKVLEPFVQNTKRLVDYDMCCIWVVSDSENSLVPSAQYLQTGNIDNENAKITDEFFKIELKRGKGLVGKLDGKILILNTKKDISSMYDKQNLSIHLKDMQSYLGIPIIFEGKHVGVIELGSKKENEFNEIDDISLLESLSAHAGSYIRNVKVTKALTYFMSSELPIYEYIGLVENKISSLINSRICSIYLREEVNKGPAYLVASNGVEKNMILDASMFLNPKKEEKAFFNPDEGVTGWVLSNGKTVSLPKSKSDDDRAEVISDFNLNYRPSNSKEIKNWSKKDCESFEKHTKPSDSSEALICTPIISVNKEGKKDIYGVIKLVGKPEGNIGEEFSVDGKNMLETCSNCIGIALKSKYAEFENNKRLFEVVAALAAAIDAKDPYTDKHSKNVQKLCERIGIRMGFDSKKLAELRMAALLHDIGKIGIPETILSKPSQFNEAERYMISIHPELGASFIKKVDDLKNIKEGILDHHEYYDGNGGYPGKKKGKDISEFGRIIAIADSFDAITSKRPYKDQTDYGEAFSELRKNAGTQFDPEIVKLFCDEFGSLYDTLSSENK